MYYVDDMSQAKSSHQNIIYLLHHPESEHVYVGQSSQGLKRPRQHSSQRSLDKLGHLPRIKWIKSLKQRGLEPEITVLEECASTGDLDEAECFHIANFKSLGIPLLNLTEGGDGGAEISRRYWANPEAREKKRIERQGKKWNNEVRAKMSASAKGKPKSVEHRANLSIAASAAMKFRWQDLTYRAQQVEIQRVAKARKSEAAKRNWADEDYRARNATARDADYRTKQSEIAKAACAREEVKAKRSEARKHTWESEEYRATMSEALRRGWVKRRKKPDDPQ